MKITEKIVIDQYYQALVKKNPEYLGVFFVGVKTTGIFCLPTCHAFQRMYRINTAYDELQQGKTATETAFDSGYSSLSGFGYTYKKLTGQSPSQADNQSIIPRHRVIGSDGSLKEYGGGVERKKWLLELGKSNR